MQLGKHGFDTFFSFAQATKFPGLARIAAKIMANIIRHPVGPMTVRSRDLVQDSLFPVCFVCTSAGLDLFGA